MSVGCKGPVGSAMHEVSPRAARCIFQALAKHQLVDPGMALGGQGEEHGSAPLKLVGCS